MRILSAIIAVVALVVPVPMDAVTARAAVTYDATVLTDQPVMFLTGAHVGSRTEPDATGHGHDASYLPASSTWAAASLPNGDRGPAANGASQYMQVPDSPALTDTTTGSMTIEAWVRPDVLQFTHQESTGYVHWLGKGVTGQQEYAFRMYSLDNDEGRPNRISAYQFNLAGGPGVGGYFQDEVDTAHWIHVVAVYICSPTTHCPDGRIRWYKNGVLRQTTGFTQSYATINNAGNGTAPLRIFTRDFASFFAGAVAKIAVYPTALSTTKIANHYKSMCPAGGSTQGCSAP